jgi:hypothetical protein
MIINIIRVIRQWNNPFVAWFWPRANSFHLCNRAYAIRILLLLLLYTHTIANEFKTFTFLAARQRWYLSSYHTYTHDGLYWSPRSTQYHRCVLLINRINVCAIDSILLKSRLKVNVDDHVPHPCATTILPFLQTILIYTYITLPAAIR